MTKKNNYCFIFSFFIFLTLLFSATLPSIAGQCITYEGYQRVNNGSNKLKCKLKYTTLQFGPRSFCDRDKSCNLAGLTKLKQSVDYRKADIRRLEGCLKEIKKEERGEGDDLVNKCPSYKDIFNEHIKPDRGMIIRSIAILKGEVRQIETIIYHISSKTLQAFFRGLREGLVKAKECLVEGLGALDDAARFVEDTARDATGTVQDYAYAGQVAADDALATGIADAHREQAYIFNYRDVFGTTNEDEIIDGVRSGKFLIPQILMDIQSGKISEAGAKRLLVRIDKDVPNGRAAILRAYEGMALASRWADKESGEAAKAEDVRKAMDELHRVIHLPEYGGYAAITEALALARERGDEAKANEIEVHWKRFNKWVRSLNKGEDNPTKFLDAVGEYQRQMAYFHGVIADYRGEDYNKDRAKFKILETVVATAQAIRVASNVVGGALARVTLGPAGGALYSYLMETGQDVILYYGGAGPAPTVEDYLGYGKAVAPNPAGRARLTLPETSPAPSRTTGIPVATGVSSTVEPTAPKPAVPVVTVPPKPEPPVVIKDPTVLSKRPPNPSTKLVESTPVPLNPNPSQTSWELPLEWWAHIVVGNVDPSVKLLKGGLHTVQGLAKFMGDTGHKPTSIVTLPNGVKRIILPSVSLLNSSKISL